MPIINFTDADSMIAVTPPADYYTAEVARIDGPKQSNSGKSINWFATFRIIDGKYKGKEIDVAFSSGSKTPSVLGTSCWMSTGYMKQLFAAVQGIKPDDVQKDGNNTDDLLHKPIDIKIDVATGDGGALVNTIIGFYPQGTGKAMAAGGNPFA